ncbi:MAG: type II secretion system protein GspM [Marinagarivorans sp.]
MNSIKDTFLQASPREQLLIVLGGGALVVVLLFVVFLFPMQAKATLQKRNADRVLVERQEVKELASALLGQQQNPSSAGSGSLVDMLNRTLPKYELQMEDFQPNGNTDAKVRIAKADLNKVLAWLNELENVENVQIKEFSAAAGPETGTAIANLRLHRE